MAVRKFINIYHLISIGALLLIWQVASNYIFGKLALPDIPIVFQSLYAMAKSGEIYSHVLISLCRILIGYFSAGIIGVCIGMLMGRFFLIRGLIEPVLGFLRCIAPIALIPLAIVWFGIGETSKYFIIFYSSIIVIIYNTMAGMLSTPKIRISAAQCLGASSFKIFFNILLPSSLPFILTGLRIALGFAFMSVVAAEMIAAEKGIGFLIMNARLMTLVDKIFVGLLCLGTMGIISDQVYRYLIEKTMRRYMLTGSQRD